MSVELDKLAKDVVEAIEPDEVEPGADEKDHPKKSGKKKKKGMKKARKTATRVLIGIIVVAAVALCGFAGWWLNDVFQEDDPAEVYSIRQEILPVLKVSTYEYNFTKVLKYSDSNQLFSLDVPFTDNMYIATIEGTAQIGVDLSEDDEQYFDVQEETDENGQLTGEVVTLPHSEVLEVALHNDTVEVLYSKDRLFNHVTTDDFNSLLVDAEQQARDEIEDGDTLEKSDERMEELVVKLVHSLVGDDVTVTVNFVDKDAAE